MSNRFLIVVIYFLLVFVSNEARKEDYTGKWKTIGYYCLFITPIVAIIYFINENMGKDEAVSIQYMLRHLGLIIPLSVIAYFGLNSIKKMRYMNDEYNHKQRLMQTYLNFSRRGIDETLRKDFNNIIIKTVADNPNKKFKENKLWFDKLVDSIGDKSDSKGEPTSPEPKESNTKQDNTT